VVEWTFLIYVEADTNLEKYCLLNLKGMLEAERSDQVRIVLQVDRAKEDEPETEGFTGKDLPGVPNFATTKRLILRKDRFEELADLGPLDTTDGKNLGDFIAWGAKKFPAKKMVLAFMDHGAAWSGWGHDMSAGEKTLRPKDLGAALERGRAEAGIGPFDLILFESCLMSSLEVLRVIQPHARTVIASEEVTYIGGGQYWKSALTALHRKLDQTPIEFAKLYVNEWMGFFENHKKPSVRAYGEGLTFAVIDHQKIPDIVQAADKLSEALTARMRSDPTTWIRVAIARNQAEEYGGHDEDGLQCRDLHNFAQGLVGLGADVDRTRDALLRAIEAAVLHRLRGSKRARGYSISALFPGNDTIYQKEMFREAGAHEASNAACANWLRMVSTFYEIQAKDRKPPEIGRVESGARELRVGEAVPVRTSFTADDVKECHFVLLSPWGEKFVVLGMYPIDPKQGRIESVFDGRWASVKIPWGITSAQMRACVTGYQRLDDRSYLLTVPARYRTPDSKTDKKVSLFFSATQEPDGRLQRGKFLYAYEFSPFGAVQVELEKEGELMAVWLAMDRTGKMEEVPMRMEGFKVKEEAIELIQTPLGIWRPKVGFRITDLADNTVLQVTDFTLIKEIKFGILSSFGPTRPGPKTVCAQKGCEGAERETLFCKEIKKFEPCADPSKCAGVKNAEGFRAEELSVFQSAKHTHHVLFEHTLHCESLENMQGIVKHPLGEPMWRPENSEAWRGYECRGCGVCFDVLPKDATKVLQDQVLEPKCTDRDPPWHHLSHWGFNSKLPRRHARSDHRSYAAEQKE